MKSEGGKRRKGSTTARPLRININKVCDRGNREPSLIGGSSSSVHATVTSKRKAQVNYCPYSVIR